MDALRACILVAIVQVACGHLGFERRAIDGDAGPTDGDAGAVDDAGNPIGAFGVPQPLTTLNSSADDMSPTMTADLLEICFVSNRGGPFAVYCSSRSDPAAPWPAPTMSAVSSNGGTEESVGLSADGLTMYLALIPVLSDELDLGIARRSTRSDTWSQPVLITELSMPAIAEMDPQPSPDELELWYQSQATSTSDRELFRSERSTPDASWSPGMAVTELGDASAPPSSPAISGNGTVYFVKTLVSLVDADIYRAPRISPTTFGAPEPVAEVNTGVEESGVWISPDQRTMAFARRETDNYDVYVTTR